MLLRRITKHVTDQNWFAVFIDFLIVVVGVFIGIQVTNWNAQRIEKSLEESYLERLKSNITESRDSTKRTTTKWIERNSYLNIVVNSLENCSLSDDHQAEFAIGFKDTLKIWTFMGNFMDNSTFNLAKLDL